MTGHVHIVMYSTGLCPYCWRARRLLDKKGVRYTEIRVDKEPGRWGEMQQRSNRNTVPQIFAGDVHIGGFDDMAELDRRDELDRLLGIA